MTPPRVDGAGQITGVVGQYEVLRNAALGCALPPEARSGLMLFLRHGLWGWARLMAVVGAIPSPQPRRAASLDVPAGEESTTVIHIFAAMAMGTEARGATR